MKQIILMTTVAILASVSSGCLTCCAPNYDMYPAYGGAWERTNRTTGRLGSVFAPAGNPVIVTEAETPTDADSPQPTDAGEREWQEPADDQGALTEPDGGGSTLPPLPDESPSADPMPSLPMPRNPLAPSETSAVEPSRLNELPVVEGAPSGPSLAPADGHRLSGIYSPLR